ncbi:MAG TPA: hypothetical protein VHF89_14105 [Solirubrobacteraceae bacterium]|nr:hypothetical protein [Solirubrobacteraceae bacterium]
MADAGRRGRRAAGLASLGLLLLETLGTLLMWAPIPVGWFWIGAQVYHVTGSILADGVVALAGFLVTVVLLMKLLTRVDAAWVRLRRRAGHEQREGALNQVVIASTTVAVLAFWVWFHVMEKAFVLRFMPSQ